MHAPRRTCGTARRRVRVRGSRTGYTICGLPRPIAALRQPGARSFFAGRNVWPSGALCLALALSVFWMVRNTPIVAEDPTRGAVGMRFTFEDFANASR